MDVTARLAALVACGALVAVCVPVPGAAPAPPLRVKIVSSFPLQGPGRTQTVPIVNAIKMALEEQGGKAGNTIVEYESHDDASAARQAWDAEVEAENARRAAADPSVVAYIATFNSPAARISVPITCQAGLLMISPANTYPGLTQSFEKDEPGKYYPGCARTFARVIPTDGVQGTVAARWAKELGAKKVYIVHDAELYGTVLAEAFRVFVKRLGLEEAGYDAAPKALDFRALANKVVSSGADLVYHGGNGSNDPGFVLRDLKRANPSIRFMGPDGIRTPQLLRQAGGDAVGTYLTSEVIPVASYTGRAKEWAGRYRARYGESPGDYSIYGYDAAKVVLAAIAKAGQRSNDRAAIRELVMGTKDFDGILGRWSFDEHGDTSLRTTGGWKFTKLGNDFESSIEFQKELN